ncbi:MAG: hypothetical protein HZA92_15780 [Verrucomicrobia bacterium]|nr:hypothetical protein [Verrucomicrobiota bacterium]
MRAVLPLGLSLALTGALLAMNYALLQAREDPPSAGAERKVMVTTKRVVRNTPPVSQPAPASNAPPFHWSALESADYSVYAANLRAVGCPERTLRDILLPDIEKLYDERAKELSDGPEDTFWETADQREARQRQREAKLRALELEKRALVQRLLGAEMSYEALKELRSAGMASAILELLLGFTDTAQSDQLFTVFHLREEDAKAHLAVTEGILLDEDITQLHALRDRLENGLARVLAPHELEELRLRVAALEGMEHLTRRSGVNVSGAELREIARIRADTRDVFAKMLNLDEEIYSEELRAKGDAAFQDLLRRYVGLERFADTERGKDGLFRELFQSTEKLGVAKAALVQAYEARRAAATQAQEIRADQQLSNEERLLLLAALRARTAQALLRSLGPVGFGAYLKEHGQQLTNSLSMPAARQRTGAVPAR